MSSVLKIVHAGGFVERYYMAIPAAEVMKKYPSFLLTKPEVFRRPWESVVQPDEILTPGGKYFVVPTRTVKKLRRRIRRPSKEVYAKSLESKSSKDFLKRSEVQQGETSCASSGSGMKSAAKKHVTFAGIDVKHKVRQMDKPRESSNPDQPNGAGKGRARNHVTWQPTLDSVSESLERPIV